MYTQPILKVNDARRMAITMVGCRKEQGEHIPVLAGTINRMGRIPAATLAGYATRPAYFRTARLVSATTKVVTFKLGGAY